MFRVAEVNRHLLETLEDGYPDFWIEGELSDVKRVARGHVYFAINDEQERAQLRAVMFSREASRARAKLTSGERVRLRGGLSLYPQSGQLQFIARIALPAGEGDLAAKWEKIRAKLQAEGLLDPDRKRQPPVAPRVVGVVTSLQGAALADMIRVAHSRAPVRLVVADCRVQGTEAPRSIVRALHAIQQLAALDVVLLGRGGGSAEDLWAFNDERVARAVAKCRVPVICGVGHETDVTIAELVADIRASTPSNAAELAVPEMTALAEQLTSRHRRLRSAAMALVRRRRLVIGELTSRLDDPRRHIANKKRELQDVEQALQTRVRASLAEHRAGLSALQQRLNQQDPRRALQLDRQRLRDLMFRLERASRRDLARRRQALERLRTECRSQAKPLVHQAQAKLAPLSGRLHALSPLQVLERGYAIAFDEAGRALTRAEQTEPGEPLRIRLANGEIDVRVEKVNS